MTRTTVQDLPRPSVVLRPLPDWRRRAACRDMAPSIYFPERRASANDYSQARVICATCSVVEPCLAAGMSEVHGMWGGTTPRERQALRRHQDDHEEPRLEELRTA